MFPLENRLVAGVGDITVLLCYVGLKERFFSVDVLYPGCSPPNSTCESADALPPSGGKRYIEPVA